MRVSIFSKFDMAGGSEFRCVELANGIVNYSDYDAYLLVEKKFPTKLRAYVSPLVTIIEDCFMQPKYFYETDFLVVVNTDAKEFSTEDYWLGRSARHNISIDLDKMSGKTICFLYNFLVSPSRHLKELYKYNMNLKIVTTNTKFFNEISKQDRYEDVRILPRHMLGSPIDPSRLNIFERKPKEEVCFGMHSKRLGNKWNDEFPKLIKEINNRYPEGKVKFRFMGMKEQVRKKLSSFENVVVLKEDEELVKDFLSKLDVFLFFPDWKREEPWARVIAEAMVSGCPIIALNRGGTSDQVLKDNNGILCKNYKDYFKAVIKFIEHPELISKMSNNSIKISKSFYSEFLIKKLLFILHS